MRVPKMADKNKEDDVKQPENQNDAPAAVADEEAAEEEFKFVEDPTFSVDYKGDCAYEVGVSIPAANTKKKADELFEELKREAEVPGFRKGRAPRKLVERKFSKAVRGEVKSTLVSAAFRKLVDDEDLKPLSTPDIDGLDEKAELSESDPMAFTLKFEVAPRVQLGDYHAIKVERPVLKIADEEVDNAVKEMQSRFAIFETLEGGVAAEGDQTIIDFKGTIDGEPFQGGSAENYPYILGSKRFFPEFEEVLLGSSSGDELTCEVTFPEDYHGESVRGKKAQFAIKVNEVKRRNIPELNDELAKQAGYEGVDDMREKVEKRLRDGAASQGNHIAETRALDALVEASTFELPKSMLEAMANDVYESEVNRLMQMRAPMSDITAREDEMRENAKTSAENNLKRLVALLEAGKAEGVEVTEQDFEQEAEAISQRTGMELDLVSTYLSQGDHRGEYEDRIFRNKALKAVMAHVAVEDKEVESAELEQPDETEES